MRQMRYLPFILLTFWNCTNQGQMPVPTPDRVSKSLPSPIRPWQWYFEDNLKDIQSREIEEIGHPVYTIADTWLAAGFVDQANRLLSAYWAYKTTDPEDFHNIHDGFQVMWSVSGKRPDPLPVKVRAVDDIVRDNLGEVMRFGVASSAILAVRAARNGEEKRARNYIKEFGQDYLRRPEWFILHKIMMDTSAARLLLDSVLAPVWGLTKRSCDSQLVAALAVLKKRVETGPSLVYGELTLKEVLQRGSRHLNNPATEGEISAAERRLGVRLPDDYREFLLLVNGSPATGSTDPSFLPVEKIGYLRDLDRQLVDIWSESRDDTDIEASGLKRGILIGGLNEEQQFLLIPPDEKNKEWRYWFFAAWMPGHWQFHSLRYYLEYRLRFNESKED